MNTAGGVTNAPYLVSVAPKMYLSRKMAHYEYWLFSKSGILPGEKTANPPTNLQPIYQNNVLMDTYIPNTPTKYVLIIV